MIETALYVAAGAAFGLITVAVIVIAMKAREDHMRLITRDDYMVRREDWGRP